MQSSIASVEIESVSAARWYAVRVQSQHENAVAVSMESKGLETFLPLYSAVRRGPANRRQLLLPLLPGVLFCRFDSDARRSVLLTPGVVGVVDIGDQSEPFADSEIAAIRTLIPSGGSVRVDEQIVITLCGLQAESRGARATASGEE